MKKGFALFLCIFVLSTVFFLNVYAQPHYLDREMREIAAGIDLPSQQTAVILQRYFDVELEQRGILNVPVITILTPGPFQTPMDRAKDVQERIETAFDLLEHEGGYLFVDDDEGNPAVYWHNNKFYHWFRIITIYREDAIAFGRANGSRQRLANYIRDQIDAHFTLFWQLACDITSYESLVLDETTREGRIYKEIFLRAEEYASQLYPHIDICSLSREERKEIFKDSLWRISQSQRKRLILLGHIIPRDYP